MTLLADAGYVRAFSTLGCPELTLDAVIALARKFGIAAIELRALGGSLDLPAYFSSLSTTPAALVAGMSGEGVYIAALGTDFRLIDGTEADRAKFLEFVPWAEALGVPRLRVFDGGSIAEGAELERAVATMHWWAALRAAQGWKTDIMIETHDALVTASAIGRFVRAVPDAAILWDTHQTWQKGREDPVATWQAIRTQVVHIHVKDSLPAAHPPGSVRYALPGAGRFPMAALRRTLARTYKGPVSLEWEKRWHPELPTLEAALCAASEAAWW